MKHSIFIIYVAVFVAFIGIVKSAALPVKEKPVEEEKKEEPKPEGDDWVRIKVLI